MQKNWAIRRDAEAVSPVIATILMVAITVVLAAVLYVMVLGFGGNTDITPTTVITQDNYGVGFKLSPATPTEDVSWTDVMIILEAEGGSAVSWGDMTKEDLSGSSPSYYNAAQVDLDGILIYLNITDLGGNGMVNTGDSITVVYGSAGTGWASGTTYTFTMLYDPNDSTMGTSDWIG